MLKKRASSGILSIIDLFMHRVGKIPHKPFLIYEGKVHSYQDVDRRSNRVAQVLLQYGNLKKGDTVALLMGNGPDFIHVWFGLAKLGCVVAFLNFNIHSRSLLHCINTCAAKALVIGEGKFCIVFDLLLNFYCLMLFIKNTKSEPFKAASTSYVHIQMVVKKEEKDTVLFKFQVYKHQKYVALISTIKGLNPKLSKYGTMYQQKQSCSSK